MEKIIALDSNAIIHRAYHAYPSTLTTEEGVQVNAVYGFASMLLDLLASYKPKYIVAAFDTPKPTFRHVEFPAYKAHRKPIDSELIDQFPLVEKVLQAFNIPILKQEGFEADDILGTLSKLVVNGKWVDYNVEMLIVSGDRDLLQLVEDSKVKVVLPKGSFKSLIEYDRDLTKKTYGYYPEQVIDYKAFVGDQSDNIPGVKGIGDKTALGMLEKYGTFEKIYANLNDLTPRVKNLIGESIEQAEMSRMLATIKCDVDLTINLEDMVLSDYNREEVLGLFRTFQFKSLINKLPESTQAGSSLAGSANDQISLFDINSKSSEEGDSVVEVGLRSDSFIEIEKDSEKASEIQKLLKLESSKLFIISESQLEKDYGLIVDKSGESIYFPFECETSPAISFTGSLSCETYLYSDSKAEFAGFTDLALFAHYLSSGSRSYELNEIIYKYTGSVLPEEKNADWAINALSKMNEVVENMNQDLLKIEVDQTISLNESYLDFQIKTGAESLCHVEVGLKSVLHRMETRGILLDEDKLIDFEGEVREKVESLESEIYEIIGHEFNLNSPKQLAEVLYDELGLPAGKSKKGRTTKESRLKSLITAHPVVSKVLEYRESNKMLTTYVEPFFSLASANQETSGEYKITTTYNQVGTASGRLSSIDPNMQNLPQHGFYASEFRKLFIPRKGFTFIGVDYSQIEFRIITHLANDSVLKNIFANDEDLHAATGASIFNKKVEDVTKEERDFGKRVNFGVLYGQTKYGLARMLGVSHVEAQNYIDNYYNTYQGVANYIENLKKSATETGYVETLLGTRRYIGSLKSSNKMTQEAAFREAVNTPVQGGAADIMKLAMIAANNMIDKKYNSKAYILLQIHDELVFEVLEESAEQFENEIVDLMEKVVELEVDLKTSHSIGVNLSELK